MHRILLCHLLIATTPALGVMITHKSRNGIEIVGSSPTVVVVINRLINRRMTIFVILSLSCITFPICMSNADKLSDPSDFLDFKESMSKKFLECLHIRICTKVLDKWGLVNDVAVSQIDEGEIYF